MDDQPSSKPNPNLGLGSGPKPDPDPDLNPNPQPNVDSDPKLPDSDPNIPNINPIHNLLTMPTDHPTVPKYLAELLQLQNFIVKFGEDIGLRFKFLYRDREWKKKRDGKEILYLLLNTQGCNRFYQILVAEILWFYLKGIFVDWVMKGQNQFIQLLDGINSSEQLNLDFIIIAANEISKNISSISKLKSYQLVEDPLKNASFTKKIITLTRLIRGINQLKNFKSLLQDKSIEHEKIAKKVGNTKTFIKQIKQLLKRDENYQTQYWNQFRRDPYQDINQKKKQIKKFQDQKCFTGTQVIFLGSDRFKSSYYFYFEEPDRIYVKLSHPNLSESEDFKIYETMEQIEKLLSSLNTQQVTEKCLKQKIESFIKKDIIKKCLVEEMEVKIQEQEIENIHKLGHCVCASQKILLEQSKKLIQIASKKIYSFLLKKNQKIYTNWRYKFMKDFLKIQEVEKWKQQIIILEKKFIEPNQAKQHQFQDLLRKFQLGIQSKEQKRIRRKKIGMVWGATDGEIIRKCLLKSLEKCNNFGGIWLWAFMFKSYLFSSINLKLQKLRQRVLRKRAKEDKSQSQDDDDYEQWERQYLEENQDEGSQKVAK